MKRRNGNMESLRIIPPTRHLTLAEKRKHQNPREWPAGGYHEEVIAEVARREKQKGQFLRHPDRVPKNFYLYDEVLKEITARGGAASVRRLAKSLELPYEDLLRFVPKLIKRGTILVTRRKPDMMYLHLNKEVLDD